jgi:hypothetical protein
LKLLLLNVGLLLLKQLMLLANVGQSGQLAPQANRRLPMITNLQCAAIAAAADVELAAATAVAAAAAVELAVVVVVVVGITVFIVLIWKQL